MVANQLHYFCEMCGFKRKVIGGLCGQCRTNLTGHSVDVGPGTRSPVEKPEGLIEELRRLAEEGKPIQRRRP